jgi:DNA-binding transcriptional LysR family regulator
MDIRPLSNALAIFEKGSIGKAAEALRVSQPALTKSLRRLEDELQVKLFERTSRGMTPTVYGECLRTHAQAVGIGIHHLRSNLQSLKSGLSGIVEVGAPPIIAPEVLPNAIAELTKERPKILVRVATELSPALIQHVQDGRLDFAVTFTANGIVPSGCRQRFLFNDRLVIVVREKHPIARLSHVSVQDVAKYPWVLPPDGNLHRQRLKLAFEAEGLPLPQPVIECSSVQFIKAAIEAADYVALVSRMSVNSDGNNGLLKTIELDSEFTTRPIGLTWREDRTLSTAAAKLMAMIEKRYGCDGRAGRSSR